jgi:ankyrin repeat protein
MSAAIYGHFDICRLLIDKGPIMEAKDRKGVTPLLWAAAYGHIEVVRLLCDRGADIEARTYSRMRPLHISASEGPISILKELIEVRNADINARDVTGRTALTVANNNNYPDIAAYLVSRGGVV